MLSRKQEREEAFKVVYSYSFVSDQFTISEGQIESEFVKKLSKIVKVNLDCIDGLIKEYAKDFSFDRIFKVDLAVLRLAIGEILYMDETPHAVAINSAVDMVKKYSTEKSVGFVNGVLAAIAEKVNK